MAKRGETLNHKLMFVWDTGLTGKKSFHSASARQATVNEITQNAQWNGHGVTLTLTSPDAEVQTIEIEAA